MISILEENLVMYRSRSPIFPSAGYPHKASLKPVKTFAPRKQTIPMTRDIESRGTPRLKFLRHLPDQAQSSQPYYQRTEEVIVDVGVVDEVLMVWRHCGTWISVSEGRQTKLVLK